MDYKKSGVFSESQKIDCRNLCLYLNFKNEKLDDICKFMKLIEGDLVEKFEDDFVFDMEFDEEEVTAKVLHKKFANVSDNINRRINLLYDGILKSDQISSRFDYRNFISNRMFMDEWVLKSLELDFDLEDTESIKDYILRNIESDKVDYLGEPTPQDIGLNFSCEYLEKNEEEDDDFGYFGSLSFNISGYILDYDFEYFTNYLKDFVKKSGEILKSLCANIFISEKNFKTEYFNLFEMEFIEHEDIEDEEIYEDYINHHRYGFLSGIEGINYIPNDLFEEIDKTLLEDEVFNVEAMENGVFVNVNKPLDEVNIQDKYRVREVLDDILIKGYCDHDLIHFMQFLGKVPLYLDEVFLIEALEDEVRDDLYNRYFIVTKNREVEGLNLDKGKFRVHRFNM